MGVRATTVRRAALGLPESEERETWDTATFRVRNKIFAMFSERERHVWIKSTGLGLTAPKRTVRAFDEEHA